MSWFQLRLMRAQSGFAATGLGAQDAIYGLAAIMFMALRVVFGCRAIGSGHGAAGVGFLVTTDPSSRLLNQDLIDIAGELLPDGP